MPVPLERAARAASPGLAIGPVFVLAAAWPAPRPAGTPAEEDAALTASIAAAIADLAALEARAQREGADVLAFQIAMLEDPALSEPARRAIAAGAAAHAAWPDALAAQIAGCEESGDAYFKARAADLRDVRDRVLRRLLSAGASQPPPAGAILLGDDITPSRFLETDWTEGGGIALSAGDPASRVAMLARARGVPMVVGLGALDPSGHAEAAIDGAGATVILSPSEQQRARIMRGRTREAIARAAQHAVLHERAFTAEGQWISVRLTISGPADLAGLDPAICDGIGLARTELMFRTAEELRDEERQYHVYRQILDWADGRPVTVRTLDAGAGRPIPGLAIAREDNPALGLRGIRLSLSQPASFRIQLRALARAAAYGPLRVMLPMVTIPEELEQTRALFAVVAAELKAERAVAAIPTLGMMVDVPAAALAIERFDAAFFTIGSDDLTQYVTASARDNEAVAALADPENPAVLRLFAEIARHGRATAAEVSLCGGIAGDPAHIPSLLAVGIRALSMAPAAVGPVKSVLAGMRAASVVG